jgi:RND family efflux transporter MFP subunit
MLDPETLEIRLFLPLRHVRAIRVGDPVAIHAEGKSSKARVHSIVPAGDARSQSFEVLVEMPAAKDLRLTAGSVVQVDLPLGEPQSLMAVPRDALIIRADGLAVFRIGADNKAERVSVTTGIADGDWVAVEGSLNSSDAVVVRGGENLHDGAIVKIVGRREAWRASSGSSSQAF